MSWAVLFSGRTRRGLRHFLLDRAHVIGHVVGIALGAVVLSCFLSPEEAGFLGIVLAFVITIGLTHAAIAAARFLLRANSVLAHASPRSHVDLRYSVLAVVVLSGSYLLLSSLWGDRDRDVYRTAGDESRTLALLDGSSARLAPSTDVRVQYKDDLRAVSVLRGGARFSVEHDAARPFEVKVNKDVVRAVGTVFDVTLLPDNSVRVDGIEGSTVILPDLSSTSPSLGRRLAIRLAPGWHAVLHPKGFSAVPRSWREGRLWFEQVPLWRAAFALSFFNPGEFVVDDPSIADIGLNVVVDPANLGTIMKALNESGVVERVAEGNGRSVIHLSRESGARAAKDEPALRN